MRKRLTRIAYRLGEWAAVLLLAVLLLHLMPG